MSKTACIILAAGKGVRMKSELPKVLHPVGGTPMVRWPIELAAKLGASPVAIVLGNGAELVRQVVGDDVIVAIQEKQLGTGHAVMQARDAIKSHDGTVLILYGDTPLLTFETISAMLAQHEASTVPLTILTAKFTWPNRLGRVVRDEGGAVAKVVEAADASKDELAIEEVNAGIYAVDAEFLLGALDKLKPNNAQGEYYLTDVIEIAGGEGGVEAFTVADPKEVLGVNDRIELAEAERVMNARAVARLMRDGVSFIDPASTYVHATASVGADTIIYPGAVIEGATKIGSRCVIGPGVFIRDCVVGDDAEIKAHSYMERARVGDRTTVGPSAHLRPESVIGADCRIGNFVETKKVVMGDGSKASHLTYLGDAEIGKNVNIGCGTITCNYDGEKKSLTVIEDDVFVGSDTQLVAPVRVGKGAYIGSGSTITRDVQPGDLVVVRGELKTVKGWGDKKRKKAAAKHKK